MRKILRKLNSPTGASITFALLLFLVCAIISSIVIVAGTTASGRMKNIPEIDRRYYAVSSAAELLSNAIDGRVITSEQTRTRKITINYRSDGTESSDSSPEAGNWSTPVLNEVKESGSKSALTDNDILAGFVKKITADDEEGYEPRLINLTATGSLTLPDDADVDEVLKNLSVRIYEVPEKNGTITYYISRSTGEKGKSNAYTLRLIFAADISENTTTHTDYGTPKKTDDGYTVENTVTDTRTKQFKWTLTDVKKDVWQDEWNAEGA